MISLTLRNTKHQMHPLSEKYASTPKIITDHIKCTSFENIFILISIFINKILHIEENLLSICSQNTVMHKRLAFILSF